MVTLTTRLSLFYLGTLALVLLGFCATLYFLASFHLRRQVDERLEASLNTAVAAVENGPDGLEWEPAERQLRIGSAGSADQVVWVVTDDQGQVVDGSGQPEDLEALAETLRATISDQSSDTRMEWRGEPWQFGQRWIGARNPPAGGPRVPGDKFGKYPALWISAGVSLAPARAVLRQLAAALAGLSMAIWLVAMAACRGVCRRALAPVRRMAEAAREMKAGSLTDRLPVSATSDELEDLSRAFNNLLDRLQESFERQRRFTGDASHQLKTPLTVLLGQIEVALRRDRESTEYREILLSSQKQAGRLLHIVEALFFLARADAEAQSPRKERIEVRSWLLEHLLTWADHPRHEDMCVEQRSGGAFHVEAHPTLLGELVNILLENACKYSLPGSAIRIHLARKGFKVLLTVEDRGCGIPAEDLPHLGEPFYRSAGARQRGITGIGLGLAIAKRLVEALDGNLVIKSTEGSGSEFTLALPESDACALEEPTDRVAQVANANGSADHGARHRNA
jgi:heavy metal sensor kinase